MGMTGPAAQNASEHVAVTFSMKGLGGISPRRYFAILTASAPQRLRGATQRLRVRACYCGLSTATTLSSPLPTVVLGASKLHAAPSAGAPHLLHTHDQPSCGPSNKVGPHFFSDFPRFHGCGSFFLHLIFFRMSSSSFGF